MFLQVSWMTSGRLKEAILLHREFSLNLKKAGVVYNLDGL